VTPLAQFNMRSKCDVQKVTLDPILTGQIIMPVPGSNPAAQERIRRCVSDMFRSRLRRYQVHREMYYSFVKLLAKERGELAKSERKKCDGIRPLFFAYRR
jgi:hypothetical protein